MIRILDKYIVKRFLVILFYAIISFLITFVLVDAIEKMDTFIDRDASVKLVYRYYLHSLPNYLILILPMAMLMASLFTMSQFVKNGELTALKAAGISLYRIILPVVALSLAVSVFSFWFGEWIAASSERQKTYIYEKQIKRMLNIALGRDNISLQDRKNRLITIGRYDGYNHIGSQVNIVIHYNNRIDTTITARTIVPEGDYWILYDGKIRDFTSGVEVIEEFYELRVDDFRFTEADLTAEEIKPEERNVVELREYIEKLQRLGIPNERWKVDYFSKFAFPFANFIIVLLGLPLATRKWKGGSSVGFGICVFIIFVYYVIMTFTNSLGYKGVLPPVVAAWFSNTLFGVLGMFALITAKK